MVDSCWHWALSGNDLLLSSCALIYIYIYIYNKNIDEVSVDIALLEFLFVLFTFKIDE